ARAVGVAAHDLAAEADRAAAGVREAEHGLDERRLAGAVGPDDGGHAPGADRQVDAVEDGERAEALREATDLEHRRGVVSGCWGASRGARRRPTPASAP